MTYSQTNLNHSPPLTQNITDLDQQTRYLVKIIAEAADDRKAADILAIKIADVSYISDYFVIVTGFSRTQVRAISDAIEKKVKENLDKYPLRIEGKSEGNWILQDYGDVIVHIFLPEEREFYDLEAFWGHAQKLDFSMINSW